MSDDPKPGQENMPKLESVSIETMIINPEWRAGSLAWGRDERLRFFSYRDPDHGWRHIAFPLEVLRKLHDWTTAEIAAAPPPALMVPGAPGWRGVN